MSDTPRTDAKIEEIRLTPEAGGCMPKSFCRQLEHELCQISEEASTLRRQMDQKIEDFLSEKMCCNGQDCGCMGVSRLEHFVGERVGAELTTLREDNARFTAFLAMLQTEFHACPYWEDGYWRIPRLMSGDGGFGSGVVNNRYDSFTSAMEYAMKQTPEAGANP